MPVARVKLDLKELLYEKETYEILEDTAMHLYNNFDMKQLEGAVLGGGEPCPGVENNELISKARMRLDGWDKRKPFLKFGEPGQHYANELFLSQPCNWGSRGTPFFWAYMARTFSFDELPMTADVFRKKYMVELEKLGIPYGVDEYVHIPQFAHGGMSSGMVGGMFVADALDVLLKRLELYK